MLTYHGSVLAVQKHIILMEETGSSVIQFRYLLHHFDIDLLLGYLEFSTLHTILKFLLHKLAEVLSQYLKIVPSR